MAEWKFDRRRGACTACEREFEDGERHVSTLCVVEETLQREDLCGSCWTRRREAADQPEGGVPVQADLFWWFTRHAAERKRTLQLDLGSLEQLFLRLEGREETQVRELRYVLCLLLMRKRRVKLEKLERPSGEGQSECFVVKRPRRDERYRVHVFDFTADRMDELRAQLQSIFDGAEPGGFEEGADTSEAGPDASDEGRDADDPKPASEESAPVGA